MATLSKGHVFSGGETVTAAKLNALVDSATISNIVNAEIDASAAIAHTKLASITAGQVLLGNASNVPTATALTGDVTVNSSGVTAIGSGVIVDADVSASAEIAVSKLADGAARQLLQTDAAGTGVEWTDNVDLPGTLDVTGAAVLDSTLTVAGAATFNGNVTMGDADNIILNTTTGTKIGTAVGQKIGFWNVTPVVQPAAAGQAAAAAQTQDSLTDSTGGTASTTLAAITAGAAYAQADLTAIKNAIASLAAQLAKIRTDVANIKTLQDAARTALVNTGIMKGAA
jgi:prefoldin subunit 5